MALDVVYSRVFVRQLRKLPPADQRRVVERTEAYAAAPDAPHHDVIHLVGRMTGYRLRVGDWRVVFDLDEGSMRVLRVQHRREVYR